MTISVGTAAGETDLNAEAAGKSGLASEGYDTIVEKNRLMNTLPWIYGGIAALAALALIIVLRNRKPE